VADPLGGPLVTSPPSPLPATAPPEDADPFLAPPDADADAAPPPPSARAAPTPPVPTGGDGDGDEGGGEGSEEGCGEEDREASQEGAEDALAGPGPAGGSGLVGLPVMPVLARCLSPRRAPGGPRPPPPIAD
jgi:hypothetical protein